MREIKSEGRERRSSGSSDSRGPSRPGRKSSGDRFNKDTFRRYNKEEFTGRAASRSSGRGSSRDRGGRPEMHTVTCDSCGIKCEVPFKPTSNKPVFCSKCFEQEEGGSSRSRSKGSSDNSREFEEINRKLDKIMKVLELY